MLKPLSGGSDFGESTAYDQQYHLVRLHLSECARKSHLLRHSNLVRSNTTVKGSQRRTKCPFVMGGVNVVIGVKIEINLE